MHKDDRVHGPAQGEGTVIEVRHDGGREFVRVRWDVNPHGYCPWYSSRQLAHVRAHDDATT